MLRNIQARHTHRKGVEVVELAIVLPVLVLILMGIIEFGRAFQVAHDLTTAAREGARLGMLYNVIRQVDRDNGVTDVNVRITNDVLSFMAALGYDPGDVTVEILNIGADGSENGNADLNDLAGISEQYFMVRVSVDFNDVAVWPPTYLDGQALTGQIVVRHE